MIARPSLVAFAIALGSLAASSSARAAELLLEDVTTVLDESTQCFYMFPVPSYAPADWTSPDDYFHGTVELRFEILSQPTSRASNLQLCIEALDADETCSPLTPISGPQVVVTDSSSPSGWWFMQQPFDFAHPELWDYLFNSLWDDQGCLLMSGETCWDDHRTDYLPMTVRMTAVAVSAGSTFSGWQNYGTGGGGGAGGAGGAGAGGAGGAGAGGAAGAGAGTPGGAGGSSPVGGATTGAPADADDGGCSCRAAGRWLARPSLLSLLLPAVLLRSRRRTALSRSRRARRVDACARTAVRGGFR